MKFIISIYIFLICSFEATAETYTVNNKKITIETIDDYCFILPTDEPEKNIFDFYSKGDKKPRKLVSLLFPCDILNAYKIEMDSFWKRYITPPPFSQNFIESIVDLNLLKDDYHGHEYLVKDIICPKWAQEPHPLSKNDLKKKDKLELLDQQEMGLISIGFLDSDSETCYFGILNKFVNSDKSEQLLLKVYAPKIQDGVVIYHYYNSPYKNFQSLEESVSTLKKFIAAQ
ncbi:hypothetical protein [Kiloniella laminariae]|uniref:hypothetical protein n=1 Tax=Kiloniella laminariae TaxID=454162 RepID=UPI00036519C5|nr:hypothetical protein [Kiloniella laminariae]